MRFVDLKDDSVRIIVFKRQEVAKIIASLSAQLADVGGSGSDYYLLSDDNGIHPVPSRIAFMVGKE